MCGSRPYHTQQEECSECGGVKYVHPKNIPYSCCSTTIPYNPKIERCCENEIYRLENGNKNAESSQCCGRRAYFPDEKYCCPGMTFKISVLAQNQGHSVKFYFGHCTWPL